jgi:hypothetical protein
MLVTPLTPSTSRIHGSRATTSRIVSDAGALEKSMPSNSSVRQRAKSCCSSRSRERRPSSRASPVTASAASGPVPGASLTSRLPATAPASSSRSDCRER